MNHLNKPLEQLTPEECRVKPWFAIDGDKNLRLDYPLSPGSVVYDVGGYEGEWTEAIYARYKCHIEVFEPVARFAAKLEARFDGNKKIGVHSFGLSGKTRTDFIYLDNASSSTIKTGDKKEQIKLVQAKEFIDKNSGKIELMKINIEGGEYELLEHLINSRLTMNIKNIQVQFHIFVKDSANKRTLLHNKLSKTHNMTYCYPWIWENWRLKR